MTDAEIDAITRRVFGTEKGVSLKPMRAYARAVLAAQPAPVPVPLKAWEFVAMWATAVEKHDVTHDIVVEFGRAVERAHGIAASPEKP